MLDIKTISIKYVPQPDSEDRLRKIIEMLLSDGKESSNHAKITHKKKVGNKHHERRFD